MGSTSARRLVYALSFLILFAPFTASGQEAAGPSSGFFTTSDGVQLHYLEAGSGPAIVFVPGWTMPAEIWNEQIQEFSRRYHVVALDPRSQGRSEKVTEGHFPERRARDVYELVQQLGLEPAVLVGWSLGR
jgi:non-heme chloroperoxidase